MAVCPLKPAQVPPPSAILISVQFLSFQDITNTHFQLLPPLFYPLTVYILLFSAFSSIIVERSDYQHQQPF
ncbi:hypothetical protein BDZ91DRAFT_186579 [Kalaharituber pfeilii]|nr:hypothetical protein BDZ91DRAFT_186579 [Kalaharituber pfeilii]